MCAKDPEKTLPGFSSSLRSQRDGAEGVSPPVRKGVAVNSATALPGGQRCVRLRRRRVAHTKKHLELRRGGDKGDRGGRPLMLRSPTRGAGLRRVEN